jgi:YD repeat-containing protein
MKTQNVLLLLLLSFAFACKKKTEETPQPATNNACQITRVDNEDGYNLYEYDAAGNIIKNTTYDTKNVAQTILLTDYAGGKLSTIRYFVGNSSAGKPDLTVTATTDANGNVLTLSGAFILGVPTTATFSYASGRVSGIAVQSGGLAGSVYRYEYDNRGNITKIFEKSTPSDPELLTDEYTYDDKVNPGKNNLALLAFIAIFGNIADIYSPNNTLTGKSYDSNGSVFSTNTFVYAYNDKGFPITVKQTIKKTGTADAVRNVKIQYACK